MKKLFYLFFSLTALSLCACSDDDPMPGDVNWAPGTDKNETIYADETQSEKGFTFTAVAPWKAFVEELSTRANTCNWITLSKDSGEAGTFTIQIDVKPNDTGADRKAQVVIECNDTRITLTVEQKGITKDEAEQGGGEVDPTPDPTPDPKNNRIVKMEGYDCDIDGNEKYEIFETHIFTYDAEGRVTKLQSTKTSKTNDTDTSTTTTTYTYTYSKDEVKVQEDGSEGEHKWNRTIVCTLNDKGIISEVIKKYDGQQVSSTDRFSYDAQNQLNQVTYTDSNSSYFYQYIWDKDNIVKHNSDDTPECTYEFTPAISNNSNFDLGKSMCDAGNAGSPYMFPLTVYMGKRCKQLPTAEVYIENDKTEKTLNTYEHDTAGRLTKISSKISDDSYFYYDITYAE